ncbi:MAG: hypothetical protein RBS43_09455 [Candidatus Cloacimonas sp.]|jgi:hypothetical protein|nr:hypothetical protein [Candidatus Cloacimonas sp.]
MVISKKSLNSLVQVMQQFSVFSPENIRESEKKAIDKITAAMNMTQPARQGQGNMIF